MLRAAWDRWFARTGVRGAEHPHIPLSVARAASLSAVGRAGPLPVGQPAELRVKSDEPSLIQQDMASRQPVLFVRITDTTSPVASALAALNRWPMRVETSRPYAAGLASFDPAIAADPAAVQALLDRNFDLALARFSPVSLCQGDPPSPADLEARFAPDGAINLLISTRRTDRIGEVGNVGDGFGLHVVRRLSGRQVRPFGVWADPEMPTMLSVGSFIEHASDRGLVWGTGAIQATAYAAEPQPTRSVFLGVRGPRTREHLLRQFGLSPPVIGDPGLLIGDFARAQRAEPEVEVGFVLHSADRAHFRDRSNRAFLIDNASTPQRLLQDMLRCRAVVSSSLHGWIFAQALGIPAVPIKFGERLTGGDFKFIDHAQSLGLYGFRGRLDLSIVDDLDELDWLDLIGATNQPPPPDTALLHGSFPFPGLGHIRRQGESCIWAPRP